MVSLLHWGRRALMGLLKRCVAALGNTMPIGINLIESKFLPLSVCSLVQCSSCWTLSTAFVSFCILLCSSSPSHIFCMFCHMLAMASVGASFHNIYPSINLSFTPSSAVYSDLIFAYLFLLSQRLLYLSCFSYCLLCLLCIYPLGQS